jgi:hypothetical protein
MSKPARRERNRLTPQVENFPSDSCSLCGKNFRKCKHPWDKPFSNWPVPLLHELPSHPSPEGSKDAS